MANNIFAKRISQAFTLVELLVVIAIIAILSVATLPAINALRSAARLTECKANAMQVSLAFAEYERSHEHYPAGTTGEMPVTVGPSGADHSWTLAILPYFGDQNLTAKFDAEQSVYAEANAPVRSTPVSVLLCPSWTEAEQPSWPPSCFAGVHHDVEAPIAEDNHGMFFLNSRVTYHDITDGAAATLFFGEKIPSKHDLGWVSGTASTLRNTGTPLNTFAIRKATVTAQPYLEGDGPIDNESREDESTDNESTDKEPMATESEPAEPEPAEPEVDASKVGGFASEHPKGAVFAFGDGHIQLLSDQIDDAVYQQLGNRSDGKLIDPTEYRLR